MSTQPIVVGYDGSPSARDALAWALDEAGRSRRPVLLAYAFEWYAVAAPVAPEVATWPDATARHEAEQVVGAAAAERTALDEVLAEWREKFPEVRVEAEVVVGSPGGALVDASRGAAARGRLA
ncbi:universal stress protein [Micromonospora sp. NPDC049559]|uniref:universal stress protein n=1 Tax=Micromonospora sp. NPDC049559 TaxID=3155923 RepID=UPI003417E125